MERPVLARCVTALLWLALLTLVCAVSLQQIRAFDYWWHLRTGALIWAQGAVPTVDPYTYTVPGARWIDVHWLFQLVLHAVHSLGGHAAVVAAKLVFVLMLVAVLGSIGYRRDRPLVSATALSLMLLLAADRFMPRPELPSFVLLAGVMALLDRFERTGDAAVYWIVALQVVWANVHGLFALGIALCAIQLFSELARPAVSPGSRIAWERVRRIATVTGLALLASLVNPNFVDGAVYPIQQLGMIGPPEDRGLFGTMISELIPPLGGGRTLTRLMRGAVFALAALSFGAMALNWRRLPAGHPLVWVAFLYLALGARRNLALFAIVAAPIAVKNLNDALDHLPLRRRPRLTAAAGVVVALAIAGAAGGGVAGDLFARLGTTREPGFGVMEILYPIGAAEWLASHEVKGPICHHMADGGYLIWRLHPEYPVMTDGRLEVFGQERFAELQVAGVEGFKKLDEEFEFGAVLVHYSLINSDRLLRWLYLNSNWRLVFVDDAAALFVRRWPGELEGLVDLDVDDPGLFEPFSGVASGPDRFRRFARTNFFTALRRYATALEIWKETLALYPDLPQGQSVYATLLQQNGFSAAAEAILRRLLADDPGNAGLLTRVADLRRESGDLEEAKILLDRALELDPGLSYALFQRASLAQAERDFTTARQLLVRLLAVTHPAHPLSLMAARKLQAIGDR